MQQHSSSGSECEAASGEQRPHAVTGLRVRQVLDHRGQRVLDGLEFGTLQGPRVDGVQLDQEPRHLVDRDGRVGRGDVGRAVDPVHEHVRTIGAIGVAAQVRLWNSEALAMQRTEYPILLLSDASAMLLEAVVAVSAEHHASRLAAGGA